MDTQSELRQRWNAYRPTKSMWLWSCVGCVVATLAVGFFWGGWVTSGEAKRMAMMAADHARIDLAASVCVSRFVAAPDAATQMSTLKKADPWARTNLLQKDGWTNLPGMNEQPEYHPSLSDVGDICAQRLMTATLPSAHGSAKL